MIMMGDRKKHIQAILGPSSLEEEGPKEPDNSAELHAIAHDIVEALHARNVPDVVDGLKAFFYACDAEPHEEGEHE